MNAIMGLTELCLATELTQDQRDLLQTIEESAGSVFRMMETLIDITALGNRDIDQLVIASHSAASVARAFRNSDSSS